MWNTLPMHSATGLRVLSLFLGIFFVCMGLDKLAWLSDPGLLSKQLDDWLATSPPASQWYLRTIAIPGAPMFARLVLAGELGTGVALLIGFKLRHRRAGGPLHGAELPFRDGRSSAVQLPLERLRPARARRPAGAGHRWRGLAVLCVKRIRRVRFGVQRAR